MNNTISPFHDLLILNEKVSILNELLTENIDAYLESGGKLTSGSFGTYNDEGCCALNVLWRRKGNSGVLNSALLLGEFIAKEYHLRLSTEEIQYFMKGFDFEMDDCMSHQMFNLGCIIRNKYQHKFYNGN